MQTPYFPCSMDSKYYIESATSNGPTKSNKSRDTSETYRTDNNAEIQSAYVTVLYRYQGGFNVDGV